MDELPTVRVTVTVLLPEFSELLLSTQLKVTVPVVPLARVLVVDESMEIVATSPDDPCVTPGLVSPGGAINQLPPSEVAADAVHVSLAPGAPSFVTVTVWLGWLVGSSEMDLVLSCIFDSGLQRMVNAAEEVEGVNVCEGVG